MKSQTETQSILLKNVCTFPSIGMIQKVGYVFQVNGAARGCSIRFY